jgi:hypothetical protein
MAAADGRTEQTVPQELEAIVLRGDRLGFSRWRIATALGISASGLEMIERRAGLSAPRGDAHHTPHLPANHPLDAQRTST